MGHRRFMAVALLFSLALSVHTLLWSERATSESSTEATQATKTEGAHPSIHSAPSPTLTAANDLGFGSTMERIRIDHDLKRSAVIDLLSKVLPSTHPLQSKISETWLQNIESDKRKFISWDLVDAFCRAVKCTADEQLDLILAGYPYSLIEENGTRAPEWDLCLQAICSLNSDQDVRDLIQQQSLTSAPTSLTDDAVLNMLTAWLNTQIDELPANAEGPSEISSSKQFGEVTAKLRNRRNLSREDFVRELRKYLIMNKVDRSFTAEQLRFIEDGQRKTISRDMVDLFCAILNCTPAEFRELMQSGQPYTLANWNSPNDPIRNFWREALRMTLSSPEADELLQTLLNNRDPRSLTKHDIYSILEQLARELKEREVVKEAPAPAASEQTFDDIEAARGGPQPYEDRNATASQPDDSQAAGEAPEPQKPQNMLGCSSDGQLSTGTAGDTACVSANDLDPKPIPEVPAIAAPHLEPPLQLDLPEAPISTPIVLPDISPPIFSPSLEPGMIDQLTIDDSILFDPCKSCRERASLSPADINNFPQPTYPWTDAGVGLEYMPAIEPMFVPLLP